MKTELILITMENGDEIKAELYPEAAPKTVENFLKLLIRNLENCNQKFQKFLVRTLASYSSNHLIIEKMPIC